MNPNYQSRRTTGTTVKDGEDVEVVPSPSSPSPVVSSNTTSSVTKQSFLEIQQEALVRKLEPFVRFIELAAQFNGKQINYTKIDIFRIITIERERIEIMLRNFLHI